VHTPSPPGRDHRRLQAQGRRGIAPRGTLRPPKEDTMDTASKPPAALWIVVALLLAGGAVIMYGLRGLANDVSTPIPTPAAAHQPPRPGAKAGLDFSAPLGSAINAGDVAALRALADKGADLNAQYQFVESGRRTLTPLTFAAIQTTPDMVKALL